MRERLAKLIPGMTRASDAMVRAGVLLIFLLLLVGFSLVLRSWLRPSPDAEPVDPAAEVGSTDRPPATVAPTVPPSPAPSPTVTASPPPTMTLPPTITPTPPATLEPEPTLDGPATVMAIAASTRHAPITSPDGRLRAEHVIYPCTRLPGGGDTLSFEQLNVLNIDSGETATAAEQLLNCGGLGAFGLEGLFWSDNSRFFYFTTAREGVPDGCGYWQRPLLRFAVETGETQLLGPGERSPDGSKLASWQDRQLVIWEVGGDEIGRATAAVPGADLGPIVWSPAGNALVYLQASSYCPLQKSYVAHVALAEMEPTVLLEAEAPAFGGVAWIDTGRLRLINEQGEEWIYDLAGGELRPAR